MTGTPKILTLDIETSPMTTFTWGLKNQFISIDQIVEHPRVLAWAAKWHGKPKVEFRSEFHDDRELMVRRIHDLISEADIVVHFNGATFDMPWIRSEAALLGLKPYSPVQEIDLLKVARKQFRFPSYKLDYLVRRFELGAKMSTGGFELWVKCLAGDEQAWSRMRRYNRHDVVVTEKLYEFLRPWITNHPSIGLFTGEDCCDKCGGTDLERRGYRRTRVSTYQAYRCRDCGGWSQGSRRVSGVEIRGVS